VFAKLFWEGLPETFKLLLDKVFAGLPLFGGRWSHP
jgi:hypothetical protein